MTWFKAKSCKLCVTRNSIGRQLWKDKYTPKVTGAHANTEGSDRLTQNKEQKLAQVQDQVKGTDPEKIWKPKSKRKPKPLHNDKKENTCQFCGIDHKLPHLWKNKWPACVKTKRTRKTLHRNYCRLQSMSGNGNRRSHPIRISPSRSEKTNLFPATVPL